MSSNLGDVIRVSRSQVISLLNRPTHFLMMTEGNSCIGVVLYALMMQDPHVSGIADLSA
jgi:hypothetical protein